MQNIWASLCSQLPTQRNSINLQIYPRVSGSRVWGTGPAFKGPGCQGELQTFSIWPNSWLSKRCHTSRHKEPITLTTNWLLLLGNQHFPGQSALEQSSLDNSHVHTESYRKANMSFSRRRNGHLDDVEAPHTLPLFRLVLPKTPLPQCQVSAPSSLSWVKTTYVPHLQHINGTDPLRKQTWEVGITAVW